MKNGLRILIIGFTLLLFDNIVKAEFSRYENDAGAFQSQGLVVNSSGHIIQFIRQTQVETRTLFFTKTDVDGDVVSAFGSSGYKVITFTNSHSAHDASTVRLDGFSSFSNSCDTKIALDGDGNIVVAVVCEFPSSVNKVILIKLDGTTGALNTSSVQVLTLAGTIENINDLIVDSENKSICLTSETGFKKVYRFDGGSILNVGGLNSSQHGSLVVDGDDNIYVAGISSGRGYVTKIFENSGELAIDGDFASEGTYLTSESWAAPHNKAFLSYLDSNIFLITLDESLNFKIITLSADGSSVDDPIVTTPFEAGDPNSVVLKHIVQSSNGDFYISGFAETSSMAQRGFLGRLTSAGVGDNTFTQDTEYNLLAPGIVLVHPTDGGNISSGGFLGFDATSEVVSSGFLESVSGDAYFLIFSKSVAEADIVIDPVSPSVVETDAEEEEAYESRRDRGFKHVAISGSNLAGIQDAGVIATKFDDVVSYFRTSHSFIITKMSEKGGLHTSFGSDGFLEIKVRSSGGDSTTVGIPNFTSMEDVPSYIATDASENILIAFKVTLSGDNGSRIVIMRLKGSDGTLDEEFGTGGLVLYNSTHSSQVPQALLVDTSDRVVLLVYAEDGEDKIVDLLRYDSSGSDDLSLDVSASFVGVFSGLSAALDRDSNIYVVGQSNESKLSCLKVSFTGSVDTSFATDGKYESSALVDSLEGGSYTKVFATIYEVDEGSGVYTRNLQILVQKNDTSPGILIQQLNLEDGSLDTDFGVSGTASVDIAGMDKLNDFERDIRGHLFFGGTLIVDSVKKTFLVRLTEDGELDLKFGDEIDGEKTGIAVLSPTSTWTTQEGGFFFIDSGAGIPIAWIEQNGESRQVRVVRLVGTNDFEFDKDNLDTAVDFAKFNLLNFFNSVERMHAYLNVNGIVETVRKAWLDDGRLTAAQVKQGVGYLDDAMRIMLRQIVTNAQNNSFGIPFAIQPKKGPQQAEMQVLMAKVQAAFSSEEMDFMGTQVNQAFAEFGSRLNDVFEKITGNKIKTRLEPSVV